MTTTKRKIATAFVFLLIVFLCAALALAAVSSMPGARAAIADDGATETAPDEGTTGDTTSYTLYIIVGVAALLLIIIIAIAAGTNKKYILSFFAGKQASAPPSRRLPAGADIGGLPVPKRDGARFAGWYADAYLSRPFSSTRMPAQNTAVYAKWKHGLYR